MADGDSRRVAHVLRGQTSLAQPDDVVGGCGRIRPARAAMRALFRSCLVSGFQTGGGSVQP